MSVNKILALIALILALLAAFIGTPVQNDVNIDEIATLVESEKDHFAPLELAEKLYAGNKIRLIDLRDSVSYVQQHIFNSERMSLQQLLNGGIKRNEIVVLYSEGGIHASQAWILMKMKRFDSVFTLLGGFSGWKKEILYPELNAGATEEELKIIEHRKLISLFFGGEPKIVSRKSVKKKPDTQKISPQQIQPPQFRKEEEKLRDQC